MGGGQTINIAFNRPELFRYVVLMSPAAGQNMDQTYAAFLKDPAVANKQFKMFWMAVGKDDTLVGAGRQGVRRAIDGEGRQTLVQTYRGPARVDRLASQPQRGRAASFQVGGCRNVSWCPVVPGTPGAADVGERTLVLLGVRPSSLGPILLHPDRDRSAFSGGHLSAPSGGACAGCSTRRGSRACFQPGKAA